MKSDEYDTELSNLNKLHGILQNNILFNHVPKIINFQMMVTETISGLKYRALMSLPLCVPIRPEPERGGRLLRSSQYLQLLNTLEAVHAGGMFNCDIKPSNVLMHGDNVVLCDWGSAVFGIGNNPLPKRSVGTIGYCDFTLIKPAPPDASHDLMALVRTVYANYTGQHVPSDQNMANAFWEENFRSTDSQWTKAMNYA
jgi:serine/threonine protein kinase